VLFNSYVFLACFLPIAFIGYAAASSFRPIISVLWLIACSMAFYAFWSPAFLLLLIGSIAVNFTLGRFIGRTSGTLQTVIFIAGVSTNLSLLFVFKYLAPLLHSSLWSGMLRGAADISITLPLGISFFTFTQIGYLVDRRDGLAGDLDPLRYTLFVTFFPHLIAGPILHVREIGPQLLNRATYRLRADMIAPSVTLFTLGLCKKIWGADKLAAPVALGFSHAGELGYVNSWATVLAYSMQLYFDFSGYSDMAIGLAGIFGFKFPVNFNSPYKSHSIIEYWQRWHMTLSRYLQLLIFDPIAMMIARRRAAKGLRVSSAALKSPAAFAEILVLPTVITMTLAGVWHGAGLQFLVFGLLHAGYLTINHAARVYGRGALASRSPQASRWEHIWKIGLTYLSVVLAMIFFRSQSCGEAAQIIRALIFGRGDGGWLFGLQSHHANPGFKILSGKLLVRLLLCFFAVWAMPNTQEMLGRFAPTLQAVAPTTSARFMWRPTFRWAALVSLLLWTAIVECNQSTTFLYYQF